MQGNHIGKGSQICVTGCDASTWFTLMSEKVDSDIAQIRENEMDSLFEYLYVIKIHDPASKREVYMVGVVNKVADDECIHHNMPK